MKRKRILAAALVVLSAAASIAYGDWQVTSNPADSGSSAFTRPSLVLVSIRNTTTSALTIASIPKSSPTPTTCPASVTIAPITGGFPVTVGANQQAQFVVSSPGFSMAEAMFGAACPFDIIESPPGPVDTFMVEFHPGPTGDPWDIQPHVSDFGMQTGFEIQRVYLFNSGATPNRFNALQIMDTTGSFTFASGCTSSTMCGAGSAGAGGFYAVDVKCSPMMAGPLTAQLVAYSASVPVASSTLQCAGVAGATIDVPAMVDIFAMQNMTMMQPVPISQIGAGSDQLTAAQIVGDSANTMQFVASGCSAHACDFTASPQSLPTSLDVACTPPDLTAHTATLVVQGAMGMTDMDTAQLRCIGQGSGSGSGAVISLSAPGVNADPTPVGASSGPYALSVTNTGTAPLTFQLMMPNAEWTAMPCAAASCMLGPGASQPLGVSFHPAQWGSRNSTMTIASNDGTGNDMLQVPLAGTGLGGTLEVTDPTQASNFDIDFGTIPKGSTAPKSIRLLETGNQGVMVTATGATPPFAISPASVSLNPGTPDGFQVTCTSQTPGTYATTIQIASTAYAQNTMQVTAHCTVADTDVVVDPPSFEFGEVRVGDPPVDKPFTITNPGTTPVMVSIVKLSATSPVLSLSAVIGATTIQPGGMLGGTLHLATSQDADLAGLSLVIDVESAHLALPITGKVVTPAAHVVPAQLDLGTACLGTQVTGNVMMINDGTATLTMQRPTMDMDFTPVYQSPTTYPSPLLPSHSAMVGVTPSTSAAGMIAGNLTWDVDAPGAPFTVPVSLTYTADGTAISPRNLEFGNLDLDTRSPKQTITLENCGLEPAVVTINPVRAEQGAASAWNVEPKNAQLTLAAHEKQMVSVDFSPPKPGKYKAVLHVQVGDTDYAIELTGDGLGETQDETSFYACSCNGPGAPSRGWPIAAAVLIIVLRRRRR